MATYEQYPTPPPTSSPKRSGNYQRFPQDYDSNYPEPSPFTQVPPPPAPQAQVRPSAHKIPAQDSYFNSEPSSPIHESSFSGFPPTTSQANPPQQQQQQQPPPRRRSSPILSGPGGVQYTQPLPGTFSPSRPFSPSSGLHRLSPRPLHYSPVNPVPSPYSAGRPKPRPGLLRRLAMKVEAWLKAFMRWTKENPKMAGILTFVPVMALATVVRVMRGVGQGLGFLEKGFEGPEKRKEEGSGRGELGRGPSKRRHDDEGQRGRGLDDVKGPENGEGDILEELQKLMRIIGSAFE